MKAILVMFDSLNRKWLEPYGGGAGVPTPNFNRLARHSATMTNSYVCSMPCMPARRDLLTGRPGFLHRGWGPMEPFDDAFPEILQKAGVHSHLVTDHYHYFEEGGQNYHTRFSTWDFQRGQEGDPWKPRLDAEFAVPATTNFHSDARIRQDFVNRHQAVHSQTRTFDSGLEFIAQHHATDNWFLQIECFDPHEPFFATEEWRRKYSPDYTGPVTDWPTYGRLSDLGARAELLPQWRREYAALVAMCDHSLGRVLDEMDRHDLWQDTMLIVGTDHGFFLGEHGFVAKNLGPLWEEVAHTPLFVWDPRTQVQAEARHSLVQIIDWGPTLLDFFGCPPTGDMTGHALRGVVAHDTPVRDAAIFGYTNHYLNVTDGRHVYMRANDPGYAGPLWDYTLDPANMNARYPLAKLQSAEAVGPLPFSKGVPLMRYRTQALHEVTAPLGTLLYDVQADPTQERPLDEPAVETRMNKTACRLLAEVHAPPEQYRRLGWVPAE
ncbi:MAG: sulfatase [Cephaloticoccus sp.]|nr:sulfatase [Cephaloticoccus sp.]MCF7760509.1 sulfatase [Cephaloticoccus sp.]